jgi:glycosyltransferase involved in cell wall biosynthesis
VTIAPRHVVVYSEASTAAARGGAEIALRNLLRVLDPALRVTVMGVDQEVCSWVASSRPGAGVVVVPSVPSKLALRRFLRLRTQIARAQPDVFHANLRTTTDAQYALAAALTIPGVRVVAVEQLPFPAWSRLSKWLKRQTSKRLSAHVAVGRRAARQVEEAVGLPPGRVLTIHNGVPDLGPAPMRAPDGAVVIGTLARFDWIKGLDVLLEAAAGLPEVELLLVGEGSQRDDLARQATDLGVAGRVKFLPWAEGARERLADMDVFVLPSRNEGFPLSIVEAMLASRPVVATDVGSVREAVLDGETGFVVPVDDVGALRDALDRLVQDPEARTRMGAAGREFALRYFTAEAMGRAFEELYRSL